MHPDYIQVNPDDYELGNAALQVNKSFRNLKLNSPDEILESTRQLDFKKWL